MSQHADKPWTLEEFLAWEERQPLRYEFDGIRVIAMTGGTAAHAAIQGNLAAALVPRLRRGQCRFIGNDLKIEVNGRIRYPDGFITCAPLAPRDTVAKEPVVVFEVMSVSTARTDRITKLREYQATPSIGRYVLLEQDFIGATVIARSGADWTIRTLTEGDTLHLPEAGTEVPLDELYEGIEFGTDVGQDHGPEGP